MINFGFGVALDAIGYDMAEDLRAWRNDSRVRDWCRQSGLISSRDQERWITNQNDDPTIRMFAVIDSSSGDLIGACGLTSIDLVSRRAEFSLYICPNKQGLGFGLGALKTLCKFGFSELGLNIIWGESFSGNSAMTMFKRIGFQFEGIRRQFYFKNGKFVDAHLFSLLSKEFKT